MELFQFAVMQNECKPSMGVRTIRGHGSLLYSESWWPRQVRSHNPYKSAQQTSDMPHLAHISLLVRDYDEAIAFYSRLGFEVVEDTVIPEQQKRWVTIRPPPAQPSSEGNAAAQETISFSKSNPPQTTILLAQPSNAEQEAFIGHQSGGRVFLFLATDDFERDYARFSEAGVEWVRPPKVQAYGKVAVWKDLYGNLWDLIEHR